MPAIPGLVAEAYSVGSHHAAPTPMLSNSDVHADGSVYFDWEAHGSGVYCIVATGKVILEGWSGGRPVYSGLSVECSCPDGERQLATSLSSGRLVVCKHAAAALLQQRRTSEILKYIKHTL